MRGCGVSARHGRTPPKRDMHKRLKGGGAAAAAWLCGMIVAFLVASCGSPAAPAPGPTPTPPGSQPPEGGRPATVTDTLGAPPGAPAVVDTPAGQTDNIAAYQVSPPPPESNIRLVFWTIDSVSSLAKGKAGELFAAGLSGFERAFPTTSVAVAVKNEAGKGGVLDYLRSASQVAPSVLPDLVVLDGVDLASAARAGVLVPLDGRVSPELVNDLLPAARAAGTVDGQLVGIPFQMDAPHLVYNTTQLPMAPLGWTDVLSHTASYMFPTQGRNGLVNDAFLIQYLAAGGRFQDDQGAPMLDEAALRAVLDYYAAAVRAGILAPQGLEAGDPEDIVPLVAAAKLGMAQVAAHRFLVDSLSLAEGPGAQQGAAGTLQNAQYADIPTRDGKPLTIGRGWALAIVTRDPAQQATALRLVEWLLSPANNAIWNQTVRYIPTRYTAFRVLEGSDAYYPFLQHLMEVAVPPPAFLEYDQLSRILQQSVVAVLRGEATPEKAAADAVDAVVR